MTIAEQRFEADKQYAYRALQDARAYVTDFDRSGGKAKVLYERLVRASGMMYPWSTDGSQSQSKKAIEYLREITSILSEKIGPASRREFSDQEGGGKKPKAQKPKAQIEREIEAAMAEEEDDSIDDHVGHLGMCGLASCTAAHERDLSRASDRAQIAQRSRPRGDLVRAANSAASMIFVGKPRLTDAMMTKARRAAYDAILRQDPLAGTANHPHAAYSHGVSALAEEGVAAAVEGWREIKEGGGASGVKRRHGMRG